jgi:hypothetical protein
VYQIYADNELIYDQSLESYDLSRAVITQEVNKSGSFEFAVGIDRFPYDQLGKLSTCLKVCKQGRIVFRGRILHDVVNYWNTATLTCEGELGFLRDYVVKPFTYTGKRSGLFRKLLQDFNTGMTDEFKQFNIGQVTVPDDVIELTVTGYGTTLDTLLEVTISSEVGGYLHITHGDTGTDELPTLNWLADFTHEATQIIEFGENLKDYAKTATAEDVATAIMPLGAETGSNGERLTLAGSGVVSIYDAAPDMTSVILASMYGYIVKPVIFEDVVTTQQLYLKGVEYLRNHWPGDIVSIELNAIDLSLLDRSVESFRVGDYVRVVSAPHGLDKTMLCHRQTMDLLKPENDTVTLGHTSPSFTATSSGLVSSIQTLDKRTSSVKQTADRIALTVSNVANEDGSVNAASIVAAINEQGEGEVKIEADRVELSGMVTVGDIGETDASGKVQIHAGNIKAGGTITGVKLVTNNGDWTNVIIDEDSIVFDGYGHLKAEEVTVSGTETTVIKLASFGWLSLGGEAGVRIYDRWGRYWQFDDVGLKHYNADGTLDRRIDGVNAND